ncbi:HET-domain-containing protein, partial [Setomelanomma holmii]
ITQPYVALSHCWGQPIKKEQKTFCTTQDNIGGRLEGFSVLELPKTFQDAVTVTRELGVLYLWIDSLCIIQEEDDKADWDRESRRMESVFSQAYCTIAATAAADSNAGFLERDIRTSYVYVQDSSGNKFYVSNDIDDFDEDVDKAKLNTRAWVMQEAVLSRRTIHFSANQVYWECGEGVYCENFVRLHSSFTDKHFTLDPYFPKRLLTSGPTRTLNCISYLIQEYSKRSLTVLTDRRVAMSALEDRIRGALADRSSRYGIFQQFLHRNLLWRANDCQLQKIGYEPPLPSWTWMAYSGGVKFIDVKFGNMEWINSIRFDEKREGAINASLWAFRECIPVHCGSYHDVQDLSGATKGRIHFDLGGVDILDELHCIVVGKVAFRDSSLASTEYHILVVQSTDAHGDYRRVGIGTVHRSHV